MPATSMAEGAPHDMTTGALCQGCSHTPSYTHRRPHPPQDSPHPPPMLVHPPRIPHPPTHILPHLPPILPPSPPPHSSPILSTSSQMVLETETLDAMEDTVAVQWWVRGHKCSRQLQWQTSEYSPAQVPPIKTPRGPCILRKQRSPAQHDALSSRGRGLA